MAYQEPITKDKLLELINAFNMVEIIPIENDEPIFILKGLPNLKWAFVNQKIIIHRGMFIWKDDTKVPMPVYHMLHGGLEGYIDGYETYDDYLKKITNQCFNREFSIHSIFLDAKIRKDKEHVKPFLDLLQRYGILEKKKLKVKKRYRDRKLIKEKGASIPKTPKQKKDYEEFGYKCSDEIFIPGTIPQNRSNEITVNYHKMKIGDSLLKLLLTFVVEAKKSKGGWATMPTKAGHYQSYSNLRVALEGNLLENNGRNFIENDGSKRYRISTHPDFITYDKKKLLQHPIPTIKDLAEQLPKR